MPLRRNRPLEPLGRFTELFPTKHRHSALPPFIEGPCPSRDIGTIYDVSIEQSAKLLGPYL